MNDTKTLDDRLMQGRSKLTEAKLDADSLEKEAATLRERYARMSEDLSFQETMLALFRHLYAARKASGLGIDEFAQALFAPVLVVPAKEPPVCTCAPMLTCGLCHARQARQQMSALKESMAHAKAKAEDDAKLMGVNSVARGDPVPKPTESGGIDKALQGLFLALMEKRADPNPLHIALEVDRSAMLALGREYDMRWPHRPRCDTFGIGGAFQINLPGGNILVREKK